MNRIDAHGLKFQEEASGRFHCVLERTTIAGSGKLVYASSESVAISPPRMREHSSHNRTP